MLDLEIGTIDLDGIVDEARDAALDAMAHEAEHALTTSDLWPIDTGASIRGFSVVREGEALQVRNTEDYAPIVEDRTGAAEATLRGADSAIEAAGEDALREVLRGHGS